jgi:anti-sigma B factor antagonist
VEIDSSHTAADVIRVSLAGEIDLVTAYRVDRALTAAVQCPQITAVIVDVAGVTFCDSAGIEVFDRQYGAATARGIQLRLVQVPPPVRRVLEIVCMFDTLTQP